MKTRRISLMAMAFTLVFAFVSVTAANAALSFVNGPAMWWKTTKQLDTGYLFLPLTDDGTIARGLKFKIKTKTGYMYIPALAFNVANSTYEGVLLINKDQNGAWVAAVYNMVVYGGTPNDFVAHTDGPIPPEMGVTMALTVRVKLTEKKNIPGTIKSGLVKTLGSSILMVIPPAPPIPAVTFAGKSTFSAKWILGTKVPPEVMALVP